MFAGLPNYIFKIKAWNATAGLEGIPILKINTYSQTIFSKDFN